MAIRALISDIHGNFEALSAVLEDIRAQGADEIVCLGDVVGYYPDAVACLKLIRKYCRWSLCGNHDAALFMSQAVGFNEGAARVVAWHRKLLQPHFYSLPGRLARWHWLGNLAAQRLEGGTLYVHASPRDPLMEYVLEEDFQDMGFGPSEKAIDIFRHFPRLCFVAHSHRPGVVTHDLKWHKPAELDDLTYVLPLDPEKKTLVNIGAVGQPRDRINASCYVLFDGERIRFRRVAYDYTLTMRKIASAPAIEPRFGARLARGL